MQATVMSTKRSLQLTLAVLLYKTQAQVLKVNNCVRIVKSSTHSIDWNKVRCGRLTLSLSLLVLRFIHWRLIQQQWKRVHFKENFWRRLFTFFCPKHRRVPTHPTLTLQCIWVCFKFCLWKVFGEGPQCLKERPKLDSQPNKVRVK